MAILDFLKDQELNAIANLRSIQAEIKKEVRKGAKEEKVAKTAPTKNTGKWAARRYSETA